MRHDISCAGDLRTLPSPPVLSNIPGHLVEKTAELASTAVQHQLPT
jgi:hypothetical protein